VLNIVKLVKSVKSVKRDFPFRGSRVSVGIGISVESVEWLNLEIWDLNN
jgi:hypothetical protein